VVPGVCLWAYRRNFVPPRPRQCFMVPIIGSSRATVSSSYIPHQLPSYWNLTRQGSLPPAARAACVFYYQSFSSRPPASSARYAKARTEAAAKSQSKKQRGKAASSTPSGKDRRHASSPAPRPSNEATPSRSIQSWFTQTPIDDSK
jgi:hypothetical protein